ncbi:MAG TPA: hypothetical protein VH309_14605 [Elusimicrobiota bacterium]|nr:hypothetical protein [Elusimicrobiota bacterium]
MRPSSALLAFLFASAPLLALGEPAAPASTPGAAAAAAKASAAEGCAVPAPLPLLNKKFYPDHEFRYGQENTATETMSSGTVHLQIQFAGCRDGYEHGFVFVQDKPLASYDDRDHWIDFATEQLKALKTYRRGRADVKDLLDFLSGAKIATTRKSDSELRQEVCRDGTPTTEDGCPLKSGGGWRFSVSKMDQGRIRVYVSRYLALTPPSHRRP